MKCKKLLSLGLLFTLVLSLTACSADAGSSKNDSDGKHESAVVSESENDEDTDLSEGISAVSYSADDMFTNRDYDYSYDESEAVNISLSDNGSSADDESVVIDGDTVTITEKGVYVLSGKLSDGQIVVDTDKDAKVQLVLNGVTINSDSSAAIYVKQADKVFVTTADGTTNNLATTGDYVAIDDNNIDAVIFSKETVTINGGGTLNIDGTYNGITSKDNLKVTSGTVNISVTKHGLEGKDSVRIGGGNITVSASYEGIEGELIAIYDGVVDIVASDDGINATTSKDSGNQSNMMESDGVSLIYIAGGTVNIDAAGDGIDSNGDLVIEGGVITVSGPTSDGDGALDYAGDGTITGGVLVAAGSSGMAMNMGSDSTQGSILVNFSGSKSGEIVLKDSDGNVLASYTPSKKYSSVTISTPDIKDGETYTIEAGGESVSVTMDGLIYGSGSGMGGFGQGGFGRQGFGGQMQGGQMPDGEMPQGGRGMRGGFGQGGPQGGQQESNEL